MAKRDELLRLAGRVEERLVRTLETALSCHHPEYRKVAAEWAAISVTLRALASQEPDHVE